jgi:hypothetical protein
MIAPAILTILGAIHLYWAAGGKFGKSATLPTANGKTLLHPTPLITIVVAIGLFAMAALVYLRLGLWLIAGVFLLRAIGDFRYIGFFKRVRDSRFARLDTLFYSPLCLLLAGLIMFSVRRTGPRPVHFEKWGRFPTRLFLATASQPYRQPYPGSGSSPHATEHLPTAPPPAM